jgi:hypothetical protein
MVAGEGIVRFYMDKPDWDGTAHFYMATVRDPNLTYNIIDESILAFYVIVVVMI